MLVILGLGWFGNSERIGLETLVRPIGKVAMIPKLTRFASTLTPGIALAIESIAL